MSIETTLERVSAIRQALADPATMIGSAGVTGGTEAPTSGTAAGTSATGASATGASAGTSFASALQQASAGYATPTSASGVTGSEESGYGYPLQGAEGIAGTAGLSTSTAGSQNRMVAIAESQLGQAEQPPGSNESPAIAQYRTATAGASPGEPWCAYFASWVAQQAGEPIGAQGQGLGSVSEIWSWAQSTGRAVTNGPGVVPKPGDLIVFGGEHVGIVKGVLPNGQIQTIEGNYENKVSANVRSPTEATGYVSMS